jgi:hypothetical protein
MTNEFFIKVINVLQENNCYPKYQLERRIDIYFNLFLPEIIKSEYGKEYEVDFIIPEIPIKNPNDNRSSNLDYFVVCNKNKTAFLVELKTDLYSCNSEQLIKYGQMQKSGFKKILVDVDMINEFTTSKYLAKYADLGIKLSAVRKDIELELVYILPAKGKIKLEKIAEKENIQVKFITLDGLKGLNIDGPYSAEWKMMMNSNLFLT